MRPHQSFASTFQNIQIMRPHLVDAFLTEISGKPEKPKRHNMTLGASPHATVKKPLTNH